MRLAATVTVVAIVVLATALPAAGQTGEARATHAFTVVADATPRILFQGTDTEVSITLRNDGLTTWDPQQQFHVSYRWVPAGSGGGRRLLFAEGVRTDLPRIVRPGESVTVLAKVSPPQRLGWYGLQWDMVQEGVTWFSEKDPVTPTATRLLVLPNVASMSSLAPIIIALLLLRLRRRRPEREDWIHAGLVAWCAVSLFVKQERLLAETRGVMSPEALWLTAVLSVTPALAVAMATRRRAALWCLGCAGSVMLLADALYFRFFGDLMSAPVVFESEGAGRVIGSAISLLRARDILFFLDLALVVPLLRSPVAQSDGRSPAGMRAITRGLAAAGAAAIAVGSLMWSVSRPQDVLALGQVFSNIVVAQKLGPFGYHALDFWNEAKSHWLRPPLSAAGLDEARDWFDDRAALRSGSRRFFGAASRQNLLVLQVESLQGFVLGLRVDGQEVTPNLNRWQAEGLTFTSVTDETSEGRTSDAELTALSSLLPLERGAAAFRYPGNQFITLPSVLGAAGYTTLSAVPFNGSFWNRRVTHPAYGFSRSLFDEAFTPGEDIGWGLNDRDFLRQAVPMLSALPEPFCAWLITLSLHHPFTSFPAAHETMRLGEWEGQPFGNYLQAMRFLDTALGTLREDLTAAGLADHTTIVIFGDHDAGFDWTGPLGRAVGITPSVLNWFLEDRIPWLILTPGRDAPRGEIAVRAGQIDIAPTLLALMGIDPGPLPFMGRNLLGGAGSDPRVRPNGSWVDDTLFFDAGADPDRRCYDIASRTNVPLETCAARTNEANLARKIGRLVLTYDLQSGLVAADR